MAVAKRAQPQRIKVGSEGEYQARIDLIEIDGIPVLSELRQFHRELYDGMPGAPAFSEFLGRLCYEGMRAIKKDIAEKFRRRAGQR